MATNKSDIGKTRGGVTTHASRELPDRIARLINPTVLAERAAIVENRLRDEVLNRVRRRRYAEIITDKLLESVNE
ncbi:MAG: hypothetical protein ABS52_05925 [Gemmatimonadetes bacterium SCN 70-22]|nr:MAG: hypothetical protein ABS52_05925 [Gemmatimonadetes bacterium SCN 70-22]